MKKRGLDLSLLDEVVDTLRQGKQHRLKISGSWMWIQVPIPIF